MRKILLLIVFVCSLGIFCTAQALDKALEQLELVRTQKGEQSQEHLSALDSVVFYAGALNLFDTVLLYRRQHLDIVKSIKGNSSSEVAIDLYRIGNVYCKIGDTIMGIKHIIQAANAFENIPGLIKEENGFDEYISCLISIIDYYNNKHDSDSSALYVSKIVELNEDVLQLYGKGSCQYLETLIHISFAYNIISEADKVKQYCQLIVDNCNMIDSCNYRSVNLAYDYLKQMCFLNNQSDKQYQLASEQLVKLDADSAAFINEKINVLWEVFMLESNDKALSLSFGDRLEKLLLTVHKTKETLYSNPMYAQVVSRLALGYYDVHNYSEAISYYTKSCEILEYLGKEDTKGYYYSLLGIIECANATQDSRFLLEVVGNHKLMPMIEKYSDCSDSDAYYYASSVYNAYLGLNQYDSAMYYCDKMRTIIEQINNNGCFEIDTDSVGVDLLQRKAFLYYKMGLYGKSYELFNECIEQTKNLYSETNMNYLGCLNNVAACQIALGYYAESAITLEKVLELIKKNNIGFANETYLICIHNLLIHYNTIGNYEKMLKLAEEEVSICDRIYGNDCIEYANALVSLGTAYLSLNEYEESRIQFLHAYEIIKAHDYSESSTLAPLIQNLSKCLFKLGLEEEGLETLATAEIVLDSIYGRQSYEFEQFEYSFAKMLMERGNGWAYEHFKNVIDVLFKLKYLHDPIYLNSLIYYGILAIRMEEEPFPDYNYRLVQAVINYFQNNLVLYPEKERTGLSNNPSIVLDLILTRRKTNSFDKHLYDYILFGKSLLLSTSVNFKKNVYLEGQQDLIDQYNNIQAVQRIIDNQNFGGLTENQSPEKLYERKASMERKLMAEMMALGYSVNDSVNYDDVRKTLKGREVAIEFVDYYHLKDHKTYYVALLAKSSREKPVYVQLCTEEDLKNCIGNPNVTYSTDDMYRLLWQPLTEYINEGDKVYFSQSGMLHTIALESLHTPDGSCLSNKYNLVRLTSTRELRKERQPKTYETGAVYGGLQYDVDQQRMAEVAAMNKTALEESPVFALRGEDRGNWNYLQGTKDEVEHIAGIMQQANIGCELFEGDLGSEESFKALSGSKTDIIHLATHGYFIEDEKADMNDFMKSLSPLARQKTDSVIDPLLRSGLILSGGNRAWLGQEVPEGIEDGVLTALEISTMNLSGTDMVVMSACETGLGDITSDGVFGLQRAFKMAGVQTLVMSLWKVDDNATSLMMQTFYEHLLSGMSKREAFNLAQASVRAKYPEPYYWAGFVMLD